MNVRVVVGVAVAVVALAACGSDNKVGSRDVLTGATGKGGERLGQITSTTTPPTTGRAAVTTTPPTTARAAATTTTARKLPPFTIEVGDSDFKPPNPTVYRGTQINVVNRYSQPVSLTIGKWHTSGLAPGATWQFIADATGKFAMNDDNRPFVVGTLEVIDR